MGRTRKVAARARVTCIIAVLGATLDASVGCSSGSDATGGTFSLVVSANTNGTTGPLAGVAVAVDQGDGSRSEATTDANGVATFAHVDPTKGPFAFTAAAPGFVAVTDLGLTGLGQWMLTLPTAGGSPSWADVSGIVTGKLDVDDEVFVSTNVASTRFEGVGPEYAIRVTPSQSFSVIVAELTSGPAAANPEETGIAFQQWAEFQEPAASGAVDLDLALPGAAPEGPSDGGAPASAGQSLSPILAQGTFDVPPHMSGASGYLQVSTSDSNGNLFLGAATSVQASGSFLDYTAEYVLPLGDEGNVETTYWLAANGAYSYSQQAEPPAGNGEMSQTTQFLDPPSLSSPLPIYGSLPVTNVGSGLLVSVDIERDDENVVWQVYSEGDSATAFRLPRLPSAIDPQDILGTGRVSAVPEVCALDTSSGRCTEWAVGAPSDLESP